MITTIFSKSSPLNYLLVIGLLILCFFMFQLGLTEESGSAIAVGKKVGLLLLLTTSLFITGFVSLVALWMAHPLDLLHLASFAIER